MEIRLARTLQKSSFFWLALLLHLLVFMSVSMVWVSQAKPEEKPDLYIPSYAYHEDKSAAAFQQKSVQKQEEVVPTSKNGINKPVFNQREVRFNQMMDLSSSKNSEPVHLVGDNKKTPKPLIILLGKALTKQLVYPRGAIDLNVRGVSVIGFMLHPDGQVTDIQLLKSSSADILDQAALSAANAISPVKDVGLYIKEPEPIIFGIIFGGRY